MPNGTDVDHIANGWLLRKDASPRAKDMSRNVRGPILLVLNQNSLYYLATAMESGERLVEGWENGKGYDYIENQVMTE